MIDLDMLEELYNDDISRASEWIPDLLAEVKRLREVMSKVVTILGPNEIDAEELLISALTESEKE